jgi:hypothetical protein
MFQITIVEKFKTHVLRSVTFFLENLALCEIMWKNIVQPDRPQMNIWRMRIAVWVHKSTNTHSVYVIRIGFSRQRKLREGAAMLRL